MTTRRTRAITQLLLIALVAGGVYGQTPAEEVVSEFAGQKVTLIRPALNEFGVAKSPAEVCFEPPQTAQCFKFESDDKSDPPIGVSATLTPVELGKAGPALLFSATSYGGGSGGTIHLTLLRPKQSRVDDSLLPGSLILSTQSDHAFWNYGSKSETPVFVTADYVWSEDECHICAHYFVVSAYNLISSEAGVTEYKLYDRYTTDRRYVGAEDDVLESERPKILERLRHANAEEERRAKPPR